MQILVIFFVTIKHLETLLQKSLYAYGPQLTGISMIH